MTIYNLLEEPWIPVLYTDGKFARVGIKEAFSQSSKIRQIAASNPMDRMAILRFLIALLYWCRGNPSSDSDSVHLFDADWFSKIDKNSECFHLLGKNKRFYQDNEAQRRRPVTDLLQEIPTGNNYWHFRHAIDYKNGLCPACCTMGLLRLPLFSVSGLPDLKAGINGTPPIYVMPLGSTLLETLTINWRPQKKLGAPVWCQPNPNLAADGEVPLLTGLTLVSRRVWLHKPVEQGTCIACGASAPIIKTCEFQSAGEQSNSRWVDPHVIYLEAETRKTLKAADLTAAGKFRMDRPWPDLFKNMVEAGWFSLRNGISLWVVGFASDQAKNIDVWERIIKLPQQEINQQFVTTMILQWKKESSSLGKRVARSELNGTAAITAIRPHVEGKVSAGDEDLLSGNNTAWEHVAREYRPMMYIVARSLEPGVTTAAVERQRKIGNILPHMEHRSTEANKPKLGKRGRK